MVDLVQTPANVQRDANPATAKKNAGSSIVAGNSLYVDGAGQLQPAQHDQTALEAACVGIALCDGEAGQPVVYQTKGDVNVGATLVIGATYVVGAGAGAIAPEGDLGTGDFGTIIGIAVSSSVIRMGLLQSGVAHD